jgi:transcriptional regulator with XRE-family HTH domain
LGRSFAIDVHIGRRLRRRRRDLGLSQAALANAVGVRFQQIQKYESGLNKLSAARLWGVSTALGVTPNFFFVGLAGAEALAED